MSMKEWPKLFFSNPFSREEKKMSKKHEYKVGDKVRVRDWEDLLLESGVDEGGTITLSDGLCFVSNMRKYCGKVGTIIDVRTSCGPRFRLDLGERTWWYSPLSVRLVESAPETKPDAKTKPTCDQSERIAALEAEIKKLKASEEAKVCARSSATCFQSARVKELEAEIKKLKAQVKGEDPMEKPRADKTKARVLKPILPRIVEKCEHHQVAETEAGLGCYEIGGWGEGKSILNWHHWSGGKCPLPKDTQAIVYLRNGDMGARAAGLWRWDHESERSRDIVAYAVFEPPRL